MHFKCITHRNIAYQIARMNEELNKHGVKAFPVEVVIFPFKVFGKSLDAEIAFIKN